MSEKNDRHWLECELTLERGEATRTAWIPEKFAKIGKRVKALAPQLSDPPEERNRADWPMWIVTRVGQSLRTASVTDEQKKIYRKEYARSKDPSAPRGQG